MLQLLTRISFYISILLFPFSSFSQDSVYSWSVASKKITEGKYELVFSTGGARGWQLYAPDQSINEVKMAELKFNDSSIIVPGEFVETGNVRTFNSPIFDTLVSVYDESTEWKTSIQVNGTVPAQLQGTLFYSYSSKDEFNAGIPFTFSVPLEGGLHQLPV